MDMTSRAYSGIEVKSINEERRIIKGIATTPATDRVGDIVESKGITFKNPLPFLWQHDHGKPIGTVKFSKPTDAGIEFEAEMPVIEEAGTLKDRIDEAWQSIKLGLVRAVSIGFRPIEYSFMDEGGMRFTSSEVFELSAVTIPANAQAIISSVGKSLDPDAIAQIKKYEFPAKENHEPAPLSKKAHVARLSAPTRERVPFTIKKINR